MHIVGSRGAEEEDTHEFQEMATVSFRREGKIGKE